jgi:salicylate hydroxylase
VTSNGILIAGAGIGGLTAGLALARQGFRVRLFDQAGKLEEAGAGIQLAPNATRILIGLGLAGRLKADIVEPAGIRLRSAAGRDIAVMPLDAAAESYGAPYWVIHRADLQTALADAAADVPRITSRPRNSRLPIASRSSTCGSVRAATSCTTRCGPARR